MSRRIEIELTSARPDGIWTWRAAGAKQPKGELEGTLLPDGAKVGDVLRADAEFAIDGIDVIAVLAPKAPRKEAELLEIVGTGKEEPLVTTKLVSKKGRRRDRGDRDWGDRDGRGGRDGRRGRGEGGDRGERSERSEGARRERRGPRPDPVPERPKPKRLRPGRTHRNAVMDELPVEERPIAEQVLRGGIPAVREAIAAQNEQARKENRPEVQPDELVALAEKLLPKLRAAEWQDKADAAVKDLDELDLRDLRSVVVAADGNTRDEAAREKLATIQAGLARRVEEEHENWVADMTANLDAGRFVRALRLSSRPPKAGTPLPPELATRLIDAVSTGLTPTVNQDLWAAAVDALAFSPVRNQVVPVGRPEKPSEELIETVKRMGDRLPALVELFGLDPAEVAAAVKKRGRNPRGRGGPQRGRKKPDSRGKPDDKAGSDDKVVAGDKSDKVDDKAGSDDEVNDKAGSDDQAGSGTEEPTTLDDQPEPGTGDVAPPPAESDEQILAEVAAEEQLEAPVDAAVPQPEEADAALVADEAADEAAQD